MLHLPLSMEDVVSSEGPAGGLGSAKKESIVEEVS